MDEKDIEIIEYITQLKIAKFIKENKNMDKKELAKEVDKILEEKENIYQMDTATLKEKLKNK